MEFKTFAIAGPVEIAPTRHGDSRGYFVETFRADRFAAVAGEFAFVQENQSLSARVGTIRGLHFQANPMVQGKLVRCVAGAIFDVAIDIRHDSPTFGKWIAAELSADNGHQLWVPPGFAHGFATLAPDTIVCYKTTSYYSSDHDRGIAWNDPAIGIAWPGSADPDTLSGKDRIQPPLVNLQPYFSIRDVC